MTDPSPGVQIQVMSDSKRLSYSQSVQMGCYFNIIFKYIKASQKSFFFFKEKETQTCKVQKDLFLYTNSAPLL